MPSPQQERLSCDQNADDMQLPTYHTRPSDEATDLLYKTSQAVARPSLPDKTASPVEVVEFITQLLVVTRDLTETHAHEVASKWKFGTGADLLETYPIQMYREIFGAESGWMVYKEVMLLNYETSNPERHYRRYGCSGLAISIPVMIAVVSLGPLAVGWLAILSIVVAGLFSAIGILISLVMIVATKQTASGLVEYKLKNSFFKAE